MSDTSESYSPPARGGGGGVGGGGNKVMSVERIYQKKTQLEHILLRPDTYIGSVEPVTQSMWVYDGEEAGLVQRDVSFVPGLYKIFDEILVNAADNKQRCPTMDCIKVNIDTERNVIEVWNNGKGIPVVQHKVEKMFVPSLIFGHLLTSSNYNDEEKKVTGGRNGYGAKLCNIFSTKFTVETSCKESGKVFKQTWKNNMAVTVDPIVKSCKGSDFTCVRFSPDLAKFGMKSLDADIVAIMSRRAYDVAASTRGVKVMLNGKRLPVSKFKDYIDMLLKNKTDDDGNPIKIAYEAVNARWEVAATISEKGFQQVSFVNSIATTKGGRHVDYVTDQIVAKIVDVVKRKTTKSGIQVKPFQIKSHLFVFVNCLIENPTFDSQTKENMTLLSKNFGSKCALSEKFIKLVEKGGIVDAVMSWVQFKTQTQLNKKCSTRTLSKLKGMPKLEDANNAGTKRGLDCTLILTEGDSAKSLAVSGLSVVGRDQYGVFPLKGKILNVRDANSKQILENVEINNIIKIMGLQYKKKYESVGDMQTLRYGHLMIMTDQDQDGSHIKGLLINFIHRNWPSLLKFSFLEEFITPIVKVKKGQSSHSFYSLPEFEEWKHNTPDWHKWTTKYYKGLGTSTSMEAKEYFKDMHRHRICFKYDGIADDNAIEMAFSKKGTEQRKEWLTNGMEERKRRRELGLSELYLYGKNTKEVTYHDFVNKELILFSNMDNERSIPSVVDGLKPGSRKVLFACIKRNIVKEIKVAQLAGSVSELSAYHHGEQSLMGTIINLAQNFVGSNNLNLLLPIGQFGTRLQGGKDAASPRYIFTKLSSLTPHVFNKLDENILTFLREDNQRIEPEYYVPIIPMVLVNGADGIGTGWMTKIPNYDIREIVENIKRMIRGEEPLPMMPAFKNFRGTIMQLDNYRYVVNGEVSVIDDTTIEISELPIRVWTQAYKENVLEVMLHGTEKKGATGVLTDYKEYHTDTTVRFIVSMPEEKLAAAETEGLHKVFKLQTTFTNSSMVLFDRNGCVKKYETVEEILRDFYTVRLDYYVKRKTFYEGLLSAESQKLSNQARFILEKINGSLVLENKKRQAIIRDLMQRKYDPDPVKRWKRQQDADAALEEEAADSGAESQADAEATLGEGMGDGNKGAESATTLELKADYDYLMTMHMWHLSQEKKDQLLKQRDDKKQELETLKRKTPHDLWTEDLDKFLIELNRVEQAEINEIKEGDKRINKKMVSNKRTVTTLKGKKHLANMATPTQAGRVIVPQIDTELKKKFEKATLVAAAAKRGRKKTETASVDTSATSDSEVKPLSERINATKVAPVKKTKVVKELKQTKLDFTKKRSPVKKRPGRSPWSDHESASDSRSSGSDFESPVAARSCVGRAPRRAAAAKVVNLRIDSDSESDIFPTSESDKDDFSPSTDAGPINGNARNKEALPASTRQQNGTDSEAGTESAASQSALFDSLLESTGGDAKKAAVVALPIARLPSPPRAQLDAVISLDSDSDVMPIPVKKSVLAEKKTAPTKKVLPKKRTRILSFSGSESGDDGVASKQVKTKKAPAASKRAAPKRKKAVMSDSESESEDAMTTSKPKTTRMENNEALRGRVGRSKPPVKYNFGTDSDD